MIPKTTVARKPMLHFKSVGLTAEASIYLQAVVNCQDALCLNTLIFSLKYFLL